jgi:hypothetical protein
VHQVLSHNERNAVEENSHPSSLSNEERGERREKRESKAEKPALLVAKTLPLLKNSPPVLGIPNSLRKLHGT